MILGTSNNLESVFSTVIQFRNAISIFLISKYKIYTLLENQPWKIPEDHICMFIYITIVTKVLTDE